MLSFAQEMNLSETAFVVHSDKADFGARYFTPQEELPFAGHPTVATIHAVLQAGLIQKMGLENTVSLELPAGVIAVKIQQIDQGSSRVEMKQLAPQFLKTYDPKDVLPIFDLRLDDLLPGALIQTVSTGSPILMIPLKNHDALKRARYVDLAAYKDLKTKGNFLWTHHFTLTGATDSGRTFARSLATPPNTFEDPFTGSATGCMAAYLWKYKMISNPKFTAQQGHWMGRPGEADVEVLGSSEDIQGVLVAGFARTIVVGRVQL
jgi:trans-2,3-dihydro-3-hydroxyanthranilate isomerase